MTDLNAQLLAGHNAGDTSALVVLYTEAADQAPDIDTACFFLTHAYIFALETAHPDTATLHARLKCHGRV
ncbi:hypothetical protein [Pseudooctadecabacter sp.]|uniref:hypothetical protein n=1 Tax=Pseudooctadecabacter sp. TaxID=1966338 RepID=UPI0035C87251